MTRFWCPETELIPPSTAISRARRRLDRLPRLSVRRPGSQGCAWATGSGADRRGRARARVSTRLSVLTGYAARADLRRITFLPRLTIASPDHEPIYFRSPRDEDSPPSSSAARFEPLGAIWVDFGTIIGGSALADAPQSTVFDAVPLHRLTASPGGLDVSDVVLDDAVQMRPRSTGGELLVASTCRKTRPE